MSRSRASTRIGLFALLLGVITLSLFGSLLAANRALTVADREAVTLDAHAAALIAERELWFRAQRLTQLFAPLLPTSPATAHGDTTTVPPEFDAVWVLDRADRIVWHQPAGQPSGDSATVVDLARGIGEADWPRVRTVSAADSASGAVFLAVPLTHRGRLLGAAVGRLPGTRLLAALRDTLAPQRWLELRSTRGVVAAAGPSATGRRYTATATLRLPGDTLLIAVAHASGGRDLRMALWLLGVVALGALLVGLGRERHQAVSLAERTAELEHLYQEVARSNRMKSEFLANVSHELRTPLNAIVGFVEMLREGVYGELTPRQSLPVDRIAASATHLRHLVDRLLDIAKIAAGRLEVHAEPLVLRPFVLNVASEMESLVSERGLALSIGVANALPRIRTDQTHLRQILINLIGNAVKYTPTGGINVRARMVGDGAAAPPDDGEPGVGDPPDARKPWVALQVSDTGVGIEPADLDRIFDEFEQVNAGARTDSARRGTGLGLAISRRLARLLGGDLTVVSEVGRGSIFTVWLPLDAAERRAE